MEDKRVGAATAGQGIIAAAAVEYVVAGLAIEGVVAAIAKERVGKLRAANLRDTGESVCSNRGITGRRSRRDVDGHATGGVDKGYAGVAVAGDGVVAGQSLEVVERAVVADIQRAGLAEPGRIISIGKVGAAHRFDRPQRVVPIETSPPTVPAAMLTLIPDIVPMALL